MKILFIIYIIDKGYHGTDERTQNPDGRRAEEHDAESPHGREERHSSGALRLSQLQRRPGEGQGNE